MAKDSLIKFSNAIVNEAEEQKRQLLKKITEENALLIKNKKVLLEKQKNDYVLDEIEKINRNKNLKISFEKHKLKCELIKRRSFLISSMSDKIKENILNHTKTEEYQQKLKNAYLNTIKHFNDEIIIFARKCDIEFLKDLSNGGTIFKFADENILGGIIITIPKQRISMDYTFKTKFEEAINNFTLNSGFVID